MYNSNIPNESLPSTAKLIKSTILALIGAGGLLVTVVMPSEYGIDPTGIGQVLGLKNMGEIKQSLVLEAEADAQAHSTAVQQDSQYHHTNDSHSHDDGHHHHEEKEHTQDTHNHKPKEHHHGDGNYHHH